MLWILSQKKQCFGLNREAMTSYIPTGVHPGWLNTCCWDMGVWWRLPSPEPHLWQYLVVIGREITHALYMLVELFSCNQGLDFHSHGRTLYVYISACIDSVQMTGELHGMGVDLDNTLLLTPLWHKSPCPRQCSWMNIWRNLMELGYSV